MPFPTTFDAIFSKKSLKALIQVVGVVVVYRTGMLAAMGSEYGNSFIYILLCLVIVVFSI